MQWVIYKMKRKPWGIALFNRWEVKEAFTKEMKGDEPDVFFPKPRISRFKNVEKEEDDNSVNSSG